MLFKDILGCYRGTCIRWSSFNFKLLPLDCSQEPYFTSHEVHFSLICVNSLFSALLFFTSSIITISFLLDISTPLLQHFITIVSLASFLKAYYYGPSPLYCNVLFWLNKNSLKCSQVYISKEAESNSLNNTMLEFQSSRSSWTKWYQHLCAADNFTACELK